MFKRLQTGLIDLFRKTTARLIALLRGANTAQPPAAAVAEALPAAVPDEEKERTARAAFEAGETAFRAKDYAAAVDRFRTVVELRHDDADAHNYLGLSYLDQGSHEDAADCFLLALHYQPQFPQALYNLALVALRRADLKEAVACLEQAIALKPDFAAAHNNLVYVLCRELGDFELKLGRFAEAWPDYEARKFTHSNYVPRSLPLPDGRG